MKPPVSKLQLSLRNSDARLIDAPFLGPVLADDLTRRIGADGRGSDDSRRRPRNRRSRLPAGRAALRHHGADGRPGATGGGADLTRAEAELAGSPTELGHVSEIVAAQWHALALVATAADLGWGIARGAHALACDYAKIREQYGKAIGPTSRRPPVGRKSCAH